MEASFGASFLDLRSKYHETFTFTMFSAYHKYHRPTNDSAHLKFAEHLRTHTSRCFCMTASAYNDRDSDFSYYGYRDILCYAMEFPDFRILSWRNQAFVMAGCVFQIMVVRAAARYNPEQMCVVLPSGRYIQDLELQSILGRAYGLLSRIWKNINNMQLTSAELAVIQAFCMFQTARPEYEVDERNFCFIREINLILSEHFKNIFDSRWPVGDTALIQASYFVFDLTEVKLLCASRSLRLVQVFGLHMY